MKLMLAKCCKVAAVVMPMACFGCNAELKTLFIDQLIGLATAVIAGAAAGLVPGTA